MMKKFATGIIFVFMVACTPMPKRNQTQSEKNDQYITNKNKHMVDLCDPENMPRFPRRPKLTSKEIKNLPQQEMDDRVMQHIRNLENHIDTLENVIVQTRRRVELCR